MNGSIYNCDRWADMQASAVAPAASGITKSCPAGQVTNIDLVLSDDMFIRGIEFIAMNQTFGDTITIQVIAGDGTTVLATPVNNWNVPTNSQNQVLDYESVVPKKALSGWTIRASYTSTGAITPVSAAINYELLKVLI